MEENKLQLAPSQVTKPIVQALFAREVTRLGYNKILQGASNLSFTKDNLSADYPALKELDRLIKLLDESRKGIKKPYDGVVDIIQEVFKELLKPLQEIQQQKKTELATANDEVRKEQQKAAHEQQRKLNITNSMSAFLNNTTTSVADAKTDSEITKIQMLIGTEKSRKAFYAEYYDDFIEKCKALDDHIKARKDFIRQNADISAKIQQAIETGDEEKAVELREHQENLESATIENVLRLQEAAFEQASTIETFVGEPMVEAVKPKSRRWAWKVDDIKLLQKKMPHLVKLVPDEAAIEVLLKSKRSEGALKDGEEVNLFGLTIYQKDFY